jgi:hypothetical protein
MKLFKVYLIIVIVALTFIGVSRFFPPTYLVKETIQVNKSLPETFAYLSDLQKWEEWSLWNRSIDSTLTFFYTAKNDTIGSRQYITGNLIGKGFIEITSLQKDTSLTYKMDLREGEMTANGKFEFRAISSSVTEIAWLDSGNVGNNPIKRYMIPLVTKSTAQTFKDGLVRIKTQIESH